MKTFQEWLKQTDEEIYSEIDWKKVARNAAMGGALVGAGIGLGRRGGDVPSQQVTYPAAAQFVEPSQEETPVVKSGAESFKDYIQRTKGMRGSERVQQWKNRIGKRQAKKEIEKYGQTKVTNDSGTNPNAADFLP